MLRVVILISCVLSSGCETAHYVRTVGVDVGEEQLFTEDLFSVTFYDFLDATLSPHGYRIYVYANDTKDLWLLKNSKDKFFQAYALGFLGGIFALLMANMFGSRLNSENVSAYFWIMMGLVMSAVNMNKQGMIE